MTTEHSNLITYVSRHGWPKESSGSFGATWTRDGALLRVPDGVDHNNFEWEGLVRRIADALGSDFAKINADLANWFVDVTEVRGMGDVDNVSIALDKGVTLLESAHALLRASATTSRRIKPELRYQYSKAGDLLVKRARMGHTKVGSFVIPILMPVEPEDVVGMDEIDEIDEMEVEPGLSQMVSEHSTMALDMVEAAPEPAARRATRTMAEALAALQRHVIDAAREPNQAVVAELVVAGVARETVTAVRKVLAKDMSLRVGFDWAEGLPGGLHLPDAADFPLEADELLAVVERKLKKTKRPASEPMTGHIVAMRAEPTGWIRLATVRNGRACEIEIDLEGPILERAHGWFANRESLRVEGKVTPNPGRPSRISSPDLIHPTSETQLPLSQRSAAS